MSEGKPTIAISDDFLEAYAAIPRTQQKKVMSFVTKFRHDPLRPGIHYEKIKDAADDELRSVRIDQDYRGIVLSPAQGNAHVLLWVAKHDDTYTWAARHTCRIHPETGSLQPMETVPDQAQALEVPPARAASREPLFNLRDRELPHVMDWIAQQRSSDLFLSVITLGEIERAIAQQRSQNPSLRATLLRNPATVAG